MEVHVEQIPRGDPATKLRMHLDDIEINTIMNMYYSQCTVGLARQQVASSQALEFNNLIFLIQSNSDNAYPLGNMIKVLNTRSTQ